MITGEARIEIGRIESESDALSNYSFQLYKENNKFIAVTDITEIDHELSQRTGDFFYIHGPNERGEEEITAQGAIEFALQQNFQLAVNLEDHFSKEMIDQMIIDFAHDENFQLAVKLDDHFSKKKITQTVSEEAIVLLHQVMVDDKKQHTVYNFLLARDEVSIYLYDRRKDPLLQQNFNNEDGTPDREAYDHALANQEVLYNKLLAEEKSAYNELVASGITPEKLTSLDIDSINFPELTERLRYGTTEEIKSTVRARGFTGRPTAFNLKQFILNIKTKFTVMTLDKEKQEVYETSYSGLSMTENFQVVRDFIVARAHSPEKEFQDRLFEQYKLKLTSPEFSKAFQEYFDASKKKNSVSVLVPYMQKFYHINNTALTNSPEFATMLLEAKGFSKHIELEAKALLSGDRNYSTLVAAQEAKEIREKLVESQKTVVTLRTKLANLIINVKNAFGVGDDRISEMMKGDEAIKEETLKQKNSGLKL